MIKYLFIKVSSLVLFEKKILVIPNVVDSEIMYGHKKRLNLENIRKKYGIFYDEKVILYVGRLAKVKRVEVMLNSVATLIKEGIIDHVDLLEGYNLRHPITSKQFSALKAMNRPIVAGSDAHFLREIGLS